MFGYQRTNQPTIATTRPATNRRASRAVATKAASGSRASVTTIAIGSTGMSVGRDQRLVGEERRGGHEGDAHARRRRSPALRSFSMTSARSCSSSSASDSRSRIRSRTPIPTTIAIAAARPLSTKSGI